MSVDLVNWLLKQLPIVIVMSVVIYVQYSMYKDKVEEGKLKDIAYQNLSEKVVKIATLYEQKTQDTKTLEKKGTTSILTALQIIEKGLIAAKIIKP